MATPAGSATTRSSPPGPGAARCSTPGSARAPRSGETKRFVEELIARVRRAGATGALTLRADAGFWSWAMIDTLTRLGVSWSITVRINKQIRACIEGIDEGAWIPIVYPDGGQAQVAETTYITGHGTKQRKVRLVVRRTRLTGRAQ
jgi:hypothetical protein